MRDRVESVQQVVEELEITLIIDRRKGEDAHERDTSRLQLEMEIGGSSLASNLLYKPEYSHSPA